MWIFHGTKDFSFSFELMECLQVILNWSSVHYFHGKLRHFSWTCLKRNLKRLNHYIPHRWMICIISSGCGWHGMYMISMLYLVYVSSFLTLLPSNIDAISWYLMVFYIPVLVFLRLLLIQKRHYIPASWNEPFILNVIEKIKRKYMFYRITKKIIYSDLLIRFMYLLYNYCIFGFLIWNYKCENYYELHKYIT